MLRLILRRIKALSRVGPPPFRRTGRFLRMGMMELGEGGQGVMILGREGKEIESNLDKYIFLWNKTLSLQVCEVVHIYTH